MLSDGLSDGLMFQLTAARRRLGARPNKRVGISAFQLTAARRRLGAVHSGDVDLLDVSTHSRPKAAGPCCTSHRADARFQLTAARRRLAGFY